MKRVISWLQNMRLRQMVTGLLVVLTFFVSTAFDIQGNQLQAQAEPVTPEANKYNVERTSDRLGDEAQNTAKGLAKDARQASKNAADNTQETGKNFIDTIREKLNLDEPIDPGTKQAGEQLKDAASDVVKAPQRAVKNTVDRD